MKDTRDMLESSELGNLRDALTSIANIQGIVSSPVRNCIPEKDEPVTKDMLRTYVLAMTVELMEFLQTLDWKPWKNKAVINEERVIDEFADILAFQGVIIYYLRRMGITPERLAKGYAKKSVENISRFLGERELEYRQANLFDEGELK